MTGLEALKELRYQVGNIPAYTHDIPPQVTTLRVNELGLFETIELSLKALEIIKNKGLYEFTIHDFDSKEEHDLLKEVLNNGF